MASLFRLEPAERDWFEIVARTAFCNPFSKERKELDARIVGYPVNEPSESYTDAFTSALSKRMEGLQKSGRVNVSRYAGRDRELVQTVVLIQLYQLYWRQFDQLIHEQIDAGAEPVRVRFAAELLARMHESSIAPKEALRFLAIFYQIRRAYHLIVRGLIGNSPCMQKFCGRLWQNIFTQDSGLYERFLWDRMEDFSTLLLGETGTGKGTAAAAIGQAGFIPFDEKTGRFAESFVRSFISLNLSQFPETLIESELFGHRKGAFTGAVEAHEGVLARCSARGSIFLDEIGDTSVPVQIKLLQVLQERTFCPLGSHEPARFRGRVIAASNRSLQELRGQKLFRDDFFYRLCSDVIEVPPLRQRLAEDPAELRRLLEHTLKRLLGETTSDLVAKVQAAIQRDTGPDYPWPGNVRELEQATRRILLTGEYSCRGEGTKPADEKARLLQALAEQTLDADSLLAGYCKLLYASTRNYEAVARRTNLDRRTVKRYLAQGH